MALAIGAQTGPGLGCDLTSAPGVASSLRLRSSAKGGAQELLEPVIVDFSILSGIEHEYCSSFGGYQDDGSLSLRTTQYSQ